MLTNTDTINIPPQTLYSESTECPTECTAVNERNVTIIGYFPHMHQLGQKVC